MPNMVGERSYDLVWRGTELRERKPCYAMGAWRGGAVLCHFRAFRLTVCWYKWH